MKNLLHKHFNCNRLTSGNSGFTIVELLVMIVIISLLATISIVAYRGISQKANEAAVISDLNNSLKQFKLFQVENSGYPSTLNCNQSDSSTNKCVKLSPNDSLGIYYVDNTQSPQVFCLTVKSGGDIKKNINQDNIVSDGACAYPFGSTLVATAASRYAINLSWGAISGAESYTLQRATDSSFTSGLTTLAAPAPTDTTASSSGLIANTTYYYRINVTIAGDLSSWSSTASATTLPFPGPTGLAVTSNTDTSINLSWNAVAGATGYKLQRSSNTSFTSPVDTNTAAGVTTAVSSGIAAGTYYYRVNLTDSGGVSSWSNTLTATTQFVHTYTTVGAATLVLPSGVTSVQIETWGAEGNSGGSTSYGSVPGGAGGLGGYSKGNLSVSSGNTLYINVGTKGAGGGGRGSNSGGTYSTGAGGSGGAASDVRYGGNTLTDRKIVAGGGGGGSGGYATWDYDTGVINGGYNGYTGGSGGGTAGGGGCGGTQTTGYSLGSGSIGGVTGAGGGGHGYYGGYGGSTSGAGCSSAAGGGGSGYIGGVTSGTMSNGIQSGNGKVVITYIGL